MVWLFLEIFLLFASTFSLLFVAGMDTAETASNVANLMFSMCLIFCGCVTPSSSLLLSTPYSKQLMRDQSTRVWAIDAWILEVHVALYTVHLHCRGYV